MAAIPLKETYYYLERVSIKLIKDMRSILTQRKRNATHRLYNSLEADLTATSNGIRFTIEYAEHGKYVINSKRNIRKKGPSQSAVQAISEWILAKGIPIGSGKIRTPMTNKRGKYQPASKVYSKEKEREKMAWGIFMNIKKRKKVKAPSTNFLSPYQNLLRSRDFGTQLSDNLAKDGLTFMGKDTSGEIKIKM